MENAYISMEFIGQHFAQVSCCCCCLVEYEQFICRGFVVASQLLECAFFLALSPDGSDKTNGRCGKLKKKRTHKFAGAHQLCNLLVATKTRTTTTTTTAAEKVEANMVPSAKPTTTTTQ